MKTTFIYSHPFQNTMPELPEVETIVRQLNQKVLDKKIIKAEVYDPKVVALAIQKLKSAAITKIWRRAKYIVMELDNGSTILTHLGMTGHFHYVDQKNIPNNHEKYMVSKLLFSDSSFLTHNSIRKFGKMKLVNKQQLVEILAKHGPEPLAKDFTVKKFQDILSQKARANIKATLMDQSVIAGIGNIYAQEALYYAGISPLRNAGSLSKEEVKNLHIHLRSVLQQAIKHHGSTVDNYSNLEGSSGFQNYLTVYQQEKCPKRHVLEKRTIGGRGTNYCPKCQR